MSAFKKTVERFDAFLNSGWSNFVASEMASRVWEQSQERLTEKFRKENQPKPLYGKEVSLGRLAKGKIK